MADSDLVGVALSGGGLRAACFSLGFVQVLLKTGLWRHVDYLSTVSGGGYIGSYLASYVARERYPMTNVDCPLLPAGDGRRAEKQPPDVQRFIYGGRYLLRPFELLNKYLIGVFFTNVAVLSLLVLLTASVAYLWRCLDFDWVRDRMMLLGARGDLAPALWPSYFFAALWLGAWVFSYWRRGAEAAGAYARIFLFCLTSSLGVAFALLVGNGDIDLSSFSSSADVKPWTWSPPSGLLMIIMGVVLGGLLPFVNPKRLIASGLNPQREWERWVFNFASTAALVGVPLLFVGFFAKENISGFNTDPHRPIVDGDIESPDAFVELMIGQAMQPSQPNVKSTEIPTDKELRDSLTALILYRNADLDQEWRQDEERRRDFVLNYQKKIRGLFAPRATSRDDSPEVRTEAEFQNLASAVAFATTDKTKAPVDRRLKLLVLLHAVDEEWQRQRDAYFGLDRRIDTWQWLSLSGRGTLEAVEYLLGLDDDGKASRLHELQLTRRTLLAQACALFNQNVLSHDFVGTKWPEPQPDVEVRSVGAPSTNVPQEKGPQEKGPLRNAVVLAKLLAEEVDVNTKRENESAKAGTGVAQKGSATASERRFKELRALAAQTSIEHWPPHRLFEYNRLMLEAVYPKVLRARDEIRRMVTHREDQRTRFGWMVVALVVFVVVGIWIDANATSLHRFYRVRLTEAFLVPQGSKSPSPALAELRTAEHGGPYHLFSASCGLAIDQTGAESAEAGISANAPDAPEFRAVDSFLFSQHFCGAQTTGYVETTEYEQWLLGEENRLLLSEVTAISGAAVSPGQITNKFLAFLMFVLNLRLGQWIPNPRQGRPWMRPRLLPLLLDHRKFPRHRKYSFVTDGGNSENLGLLQLLRRRCRLIIQVDAGHDPDHAFDDLARVIRLARIHGGTRIVTLTASPTDTSPDDDFTAAVFRLFSSSAHRSNTSDGERRCLSHFMVARIEYPNGQQGLLVYVKPSFTGDESIDLMQFRHRNKEFPHESTSDQFYEPEQVESYRQLGWHIGWDLARSAGYDEDTNLFAPGADIETTEALCRRFEQAWLNRADRLSRTAAATDKVDPASEPNRSSPPSQSIASVPLSHASVSPSAAPPSVAAPSAGPADEAGSATALEPSHRRRRRRGRRGSVGTEFPNHPK